MEPKVVLTALEDLAQRLGLTVRYERLGDDETDVRSGRCRLKGEDILLVDRRLDVGARIDVLASELRRMDLTGVYVKPFLRDRLGETQDGWDD